MNKGLLPVAPILPIAAALCGGIAFVTVTDYFPLPSSAVLLGMFVLATILSAVLGKSGRLQSSAIMAATFVLGMLIAVMQQERMSVTWSSCQQPYEAVVVSEPIQRANSVEVDLLLTTNGRKVKGYVSKDERSRGLSVGSGLVFRSRIKSPLDVTGERSSMFWGRYLQSHGFTGQTYISARHWQSKVLALGSLSRIERSRLFFLKVRHRLLLRFKRSGMSDDVYGIVAAMALGDKSSLSKEMKLMFSLTGTSHLLALSGLHIGIIYSILTLLTGRRRRTLTQASVVIAVWSFVLLTGLQPSTVRSALMVSIYAIMLSGYRQRMSVNSLCFAALLILAFNPISLFDVGFQMSFAAMFSILLWMPLSERVVSPLYLRRHGIWGWLYGMVVMSLVAQLGTVPLIALYFGRLPVYFLVTNLVAVPALTVIICLSAVTLVLPFESVSGMLTAVVSVLGCVLKFFSGLPGASIGGFHVTVLQVVMMYVVMLSVWLLVVEVVGVKKLRNLELRTPKGSRAISENEVAIMGFEGKKK